MTDVRIGVLGAGRIAQSAHLPAISKSAGASLSGIFDPSPVLRAGACQRYGVPAYADVDSLLADDTVDAVVIAVPDRFHLDLASAALAAGKHVLVEKPLAGTLAESQELVALAKKSGLVLQVGAMKRHDPGVRFAAVAVRERIGRILSATVWYRVMSALRPEVEATYFPPMIVDEQMRATETTFKVDRGNYLLVTHGAHVLDGMRYLLGDPKELCARRTNIGNDYTWHGLATLAGDGLANFEITANVHSEWSEGAEIFGEKGSVKLCTPFPVTMAASGVEVFDEATGMIERPVFGDTNPYKKQMDYFVRTITEGIPADPNADDGLAAVRLIDAVNRSLDAGGVWVTP
ncbi:MAG: Gfo/Idh/MocA family oxidoreductase [Actinomycetota bacterium]|nr:Gfo/Idh/MocA family oxidoreductase [Actinomycetota bacterium]